MKNLSSTQLVWRGVLALVVGLVTVAWPGITLGAFVFLFAVYAFGGAVIEITGRARSRHLAGRLLLAALDVLAGVFVLAWPGITVLAAVVLIGVWAVIAGLTEIALAFAAGESAGERALLALSGLVSVGLGIALFSRPGIGAVTLAQVYGLFSLFAGVSALVLAAQLHTRPRTAMALS